VQIDLVSGHEPARPQLEQICEHGIEVSPRLKRRVKAGGTKTFKNS
jgi:hypothetical protein